MRIDLQKLKRYFRSLQQKGISTAEMKQKLKSVDNFVNWANKKGLLTQDKYKQLNQGIAEIKKKIGSIFYRIAPETWMNKLKKRWIPASAGMTVGRLLSSSASPLSSSRMRGSRNKTGFPIGVGNDKGAGGNDGGGAVVRPWFDITPSEFDLRHYIGISMILLVMAAMGAAAYNQFFKEASTPFAFPANLTKGGRTLSFQGRLTDSLGNPISTATNLKFKLYNASTGGTTLYDSTACSLTPDQDGVFDVLIGGSAYSPTPPQEVCGTEITENIFSDWPNVYLGVTIGSDSEATPRQQIANVGYAINAETLQGFPPGTGASNIPYINSDGNIIIATSAAGIRNSWASTNFTLSSTGTITVQSAGTGDVALTATESGNITATTGLGTTLFNVLTGNLKVGNGTPGVSLDGEDAYIEGTLEVDGATTLDGTLTTNGTVTLGGTTLDINSTAITIADTDISFDGATTTFTTTGAFTLTPGGAVTLGDGGDTLAISTSDWDIDATGAITNASFDANGTGNSISNIESADIADGTIAEVDLKVVDTAVDEECLSYETTTGDFEWQTCGGGGVTADSLDFTDFLDTMTLDANLALNQTTYTWAQDYTGTTGTGYTYSANALTTGTGVSLGSTSIAGGASGSSKVLNIARSGANAQLAHTAYGIYSAVTNTNVTSGTNIAGYFSASGATTANYGLIVENGNVGIGDTSPAALLTVGSGDLFQVDASGNATVVDLVITGGNINPSAALTLGDNGDTLVIDTSDWDIDATGAITNASFDANGTGNSITNIETGDIADGTITEADLKVVDTAADEECFTYESTTGDFEWQSCGGGGVTADSLDFIDFEDILDLDANLQLNQTTYTWAQDFTGTTTTGYTYSANSLTTGTAVSLGSTSTAGGASGSSKVLNIARSGTNSNATHTAYGVYSTVTNDGTTNTNVAGYFSATNGTTGNYGIIVANGNVGIGDTTPAAALSVGSGDLFQVNSSGFVTITNDAANVELAFSGENPTNIYSNDTMYFKIDNDNDSTEFYDFLSGDGTSILRIEEAGNLGINDTTPDAQLDIDSAATTGNIFGILNTTLTTGEIADITATYAPTDGSTNEGIDINITHTPTSSADNFSSINQTTTDGTALANTVYGLNNTITLTGNAAKTGIGLYSSLSTSSTTADTLVAADFATSTSGIITTGSRSIYGVRSQPASTGASTGGTTNVYGGYYKPGGVVGAGGTINSYGLYVANGTMNTTGTSTNTGLYVETPSGADTNYAAIFAGGNVGIGTTTPAYELDVSGFTNTKSLYDVSPEGLLLAMSFNTETITGSIALDSSDYNNHGTITNATLDVDSGFNGGGTLVFDGNGDYVTLAASISTAKTQEGWFNFSQLATVKTTSNALFNNLYQHTANNYIYIKGTSDFFLWTATVDTWYHIVFTYTDPADDSTAKLYVNGVQYSLTQQPAAHDIDAVTIISTTGTTAFKGNIDDVSIYNRVLTQDEVKARYLQRYEVKNSFVSQKDVFVNNSGNVGIADTTPDALFDIDSAATTTDVFGILNTGLTTGNIAKINSTSSVQTSGDVLHVDHTATYANSFEVSGNVGSINRNLTANDGTPPTVTLDGVTTSTSNSFSHTVNSHGQQVLIVGVASNDSSAADLVPTGITFNGDTMTKYNESTSAIGSSQDTGSSLWYLVNPDVTTANVVITWSSSASYTSAFASNYYNVDQSTPLNGTVVDTGTASSDGNTVTSNAYSKVVSILSYWDNSSTLTIDGSQTQLMKRESAWLWSGASYEAGAATVSMDYSWGESKTYTHAAANIKAYSTSLLSLTGPTLDVSSSCTNGTAVCVDSSNVLKLTQSFASSTGSVLLVNGYGTGKLLDLQASGSTIMSVDGTTGNITTAGDLAVNGGDMTTSATAFNLLNTTATTVNFAGAGTTIGIGAATGTLTLNNATIKADGIITSSSDRNLRLAASGAVAGDGENGSIYFLDSGGTTRARLDTTTPVGTDTSSVNYNTESNYSQENMAYAVTLTPSATSGNITLTLGSGNWNSDSRIQVACRVTGNGGVANLTVAPAAQTTITAVTTTNFTDTSAIASGSWYLYCTTFDGSVVKTNTATVTAYNSNVGTFSTASQGQLPAARYQLSTVTATIGGTQYIYATGGWNNNITFYNSVYKATIDASGNVGTFSTASQGQLPRNNAMHSTVTATIGGTQYIYVTGGYDYISGVSYVLSTVYKATIDASGNVGTFATTSQAQLPATLNSLSTVTASIGGTQYMYVTGGNSKSTVYKAVIDSSGNVGTFATTSQGQLPANLYMHSTVTASIGGTQYMYVTGGLSASTVSTVYKAVIDSSGNVGTFSTTSQGQLPATKYNHSTVTAQVGGTQYMYVTGDATTVYKAEIDASGNVGTFSTTSQGQLPTSLEGHSTVTAVIGGTKYIYTTGGRVVATVYKATIGPDTPATAAPTSTYYTTVTNTDQIDTSSWADVDSAVVSETLNSQIAYYSFSYDGRTTFSIYDGSGAAWRNIARNNAGTWEYNSNATYGSTTWTSASVNSQNAAISQAMGTAVNRMTGTIVNAMTDAQWNLSGGYTSSVTTTIDASVSLYTSSATQIPQTDSIVFNYTYGYTTLYTGAIDTTYINLTSNLGIGTTAPQSKVQITGGGLCVGSDANCNTDNNTEGTVYAATTAMTVYDVAENYPTKDNTLVPAEVVELDPENGVYVRRSSSNSPYSQKLLGIISTEPGVLLGGFNGQQFKEEHQVAVALSGRVPVKIASTSASINIGDFLTSSSEPGKAMKATKAGYTIGKALEAWTPKLETRNSKFETNSNDQNSNDSNVSNSDKIEVFVNLGYYEPDVFLTSTGELKITKLEIRNSKFEMGTADTNIEASESASLVYNNIYENTVNSLKREIFSLQKSSGEIIDRVGAYAEIITGKIKTGLLEAENAVINNSLFAKKIISPVVETEFLTVNQVASIKNLETSEIRPQDKDVVIDLSGQSSVIPSLTGNPELDPLLRGDDGGEAGDPTSSETSLGAKGELAKFIIKGIDNIKAVEIDSLGNATFSGTLTAEEVKSEKLKVKSLETNEASISGKLIAKEVQADNINQILNKFQDDVGLVKDDVTQSNTSINEIQKFLADLQNQPTANVANYQDAETMNNLNVTGDTSLYRVFISNSLTAGSLVIEDNKIMSLDFELKLTALSSINLLDGQVIISKTGGLTTKGPITALAGIKTNKIEPLNSGENVYINNLETNKIQISDKYLDATSSSSIIIASDNFEENGLYSPAIKTRAETAGIGIIKKQDEEITIYNDSIKKDSLVYLTPTQNNQGNVISVIEKEVCNKDSIAPLQNDNGGTTCKPYFKVARSGTDTNEVKFNWLIIN